MNARSAWESDFWTPEPMWRGETVFVLAGGPSLAAVDLNRLRGRRVITVNSSHARAVAAGLDDGVLFFTDNHWFETHIDAVEAWRGPVVTLSRHSKRTHPHLVKRIQGEQRGDFPALGSPVVRQGRSSGQTAISLAIAFGAACVVGLGFDMRQVDGRSHHHTDYDRLTDPKVFANEFLPAFAGWNEAALKRGVRVLNATPGSALTEFPFVDLDEVLACVQS